MLKFGFCFYIIRPIYSCKRLFYIHRPNNWINSWKCYMHIQRNISITTVLTAEQTFTTCTKWNFIKPRYVCCEINIDLILVMPPPTQKKKNILKFKSVPIKNWMLCLHNAQGFPHYTIFICKFKTDECFLFMKRFKFTSWRHLKSVRR